MLGGGVPSDFQNPYPISNQQRPFPHPFSDPASKTHIRFQTGIDRNKRCEQGLLESIWNSHIILSFLFFWN